MSWGKIGGNMNTPVDGPVVVDPIMDGVDLIPTKAILKTFSDRAEGPASQISLNNFLVGVQQVQEGKDAPRASKVRTSKLKWRSRWKKPITERGATIVDTLSGQVKVKIPAGTQNGKTIRIKGKGMPVYGKSNIFGDLYVQLLVHIPETITDRQRELFEQLKSTY